MPELNQLYTMLGAKDNVKATAYLHFPHNYNHPSSLRWWSRRSFGATIRRAGALVKVGTGRHPGGGALQRCARFCTPSG